MANTVAITLTLNTKNAVKNLNSISKATRNLGKSMRSTGMSMTKNVTLPLVAIGGAAVKASADLDKSMRNIQAFGGQTEDQLKELSDQFREMSKDLNTTTDSAKGLADAYFNIQSAGFLAEDGMEVLRVSTKAATAGLTSTQQASEGVMAILNAYGLTAKDAASASDSLFTTIKFGVGTFEQLVPVLGTVMPIASAMGVSFDEVNASLATLSKQGIDFNKGATQIRAAMTAMLGPSESLQGVIEELGFATGQAMVDSLGFQGALDAIAKSTNNDTAALRALFPNVRAFNGVLALTGKNAQTFNSIMGEMGNKLGATDEAFQQQIKSVSAQMSNLKNIVTDAFITLGDAILPVLVPILQKVAKAIADVAEWFKSLDPSIQKAIVTFGLFVAAAGPVLTIVGGIISVLGTIGGAISAVVGGIGTLVTAITGVGAAATAGAGAMGMLGTAFAALTGPVGIAVAAIGGLIAFGPKIVNFAKQAVNSLVNFGKSVALSIGKTLGFDTGKLTGTKFMNGVGEGIKSGINPMKSIFQRVGDAAKKTGEFSGKAIATGAVQGAQVANQVMQQTANNAARLNQQLGGTARQPSGVRFQQIGRQKIGIGRAFDEAAIRQRAESIRQMSLQGGGGAGGGFGMPSRGGFGGGMSLVERLKAAVASPDFQQADKQQLMSALGAGVGAGGGGDINITIQNMEVPLGTLEEQVEFISRKIADNIQKKYAMSGRSAGNIGRTT
jgi:TP901 family phage tail tape measure protein